MVTKVENPNSPDQYGITSLDIAIRDNHIEIVKILVSNCENPFAPNPNGNTPIHVAAMNGRTEIFKFLASKVEDPDAPNANGDTPLKMAFNRAFRKKDREMYKIIFSIVNKK